MRAVTATTKKKVFTSSSRPALALLSRSLMARPTRVTSAPEHANKVNSALFRGFGKGSLPVRWFFSGYKRVILVSFVPNQYLPLCQIHSNVKSNVFTVNLVFFVLDHSCEKFLCGYLAQNILVLLCCCCSLFLCPKPTTVFYSALDNQHLRLPWMIHSYT
jgi:hypothetical protein